MKTEDWAGDWVPAQARAWVLRRHDLLWQVGLSGGGRVVEPIPNLEGVFIPIFAGESPPVGLPDPRVEHHVPALRCLACDYVMERDGRGPLALLTCLRAGCPWFSTIRDFVERVKQSKGGLPSGRRKKKASLTACDRCGDEPLSSSAVGCLRVESGKLCGPCYQAWSKVKASAFSAWLEDKEGKL